MSYSKDKALSEQPRQGQVDVSLYDTKGISIPFCGLAKGADFVEESCIKMLRKVRESRFRKFDEYDISDMIKSLRKEDNSEDKVTLLKEVFCLESSEDGKLPDKNIIKNVLDVIAGRPQDERFAVLEFSQYEINNATRPMEAFCSLPKLTQDKLIDILKNIEKLCITNDMNSEQKTSVPKVLEALYDTFRVIVYAEDDLSKLKPAQINDYKVQTFHLLKDNVKYFENIAYPNEKTKLTVKNIVEDINKYFIENIL